MNRGIGLAVAYVCRPWQVQRIKSRDAHMYM